MAKLKVKNINSQAEYTMTQEQLDKLDPIQKSRIEVLGEEKNEAKADTAPNRSPKSN